MKDWEFNFDSSNRTHMFVGFCVALATFLMAFVLTPLMVFLAQLTAAGVLATFTVFILWSLFTERKQNGEVDLLNFFGFREDEDKGGKTLPTSKPDLKEVSNNGSSRKQ